MAQQKRRQKLSEQAPSETPSQATKAGASLEPRHAAWTVAILALMIFLLPAIGVPREEMLQDTLKSIVACLATLSAGLLFCWHQRSRRADLRWHLLMWLPLALMAYALGSMVWAHTYLAGVEAIRWFIFSLIVWLGLNTFSRERLPLLIEAIHWGAVIASLWTALQFWINFTYFPQGPNPASTFVNRNFFAEYVVCTIPFSVYLLAQAKNSVRIGLLAFTLAFNLVALMMTGTRGALSAVWLLLAVVFPVIFYLYRQQFAFFTWRRAQAMLAGLVLVATVGVLGLIKTSNPAMISDSPTLGLTAFERAFKRTASISAGDSSLNIRLVMWKATVRIIQARPFTGIGAGAWEAMIPLYQDEGSQMETDYYVHNEILQLLAEYGLTGLLFLLALLGYLLLAAWRTLRHRSPEGLAEAPLRAIALSSLLAFLIVSNIGFPWRLASTGCIFALCLAILAASDARLHIRGAAGVQRLAWQPAYAWGATLCLTLCMMLATHISRQAAIMEQKIVMAVKLSLSVSQSGDFNHPRWDRVKREILTLTRDAIAINTHYRKITPMVGDEMARWGDWKDAIWIWESVVVSRPYVVAIMSNIARGYAQLGETDKAFYYLARCEALQPKAASVRSLKLILMGRTGREDEALLLAKQSLAEGIYDYDLVNAAYALGMQKGDYDLAIAGLQLRNKDWPKLQADAYLKLGYIYAVRKKDQVKAVAAYKSAIEAVPEIERDALRQAIPQAYQRAP